MRHRNLLVRNLSIHGWFDKNIELTFHKSTLPFGPSFYRKPGLIVVYLKLLAPDGLWNLLETKLPKLFKDNMLVIKNLHNENVTKNKK